LDVTLLVHFDLGGATHRILKAGKKYTVFNANDEVIGSYGSITSGLGPFFADLFNFHLQLTNSQTSAPQQATPAFLFLPFYFDQDTSWLVNWDSFESLRQFKQYRRAIAEFHTGIKANEFYKAKNRKALAEASLNEVRSERVAANRVLEHLERLSQTQFDLSLSNYEKEISLLLAQCNELMKAEESLREELVRIESRRVSLEIQIRITQSAATELDKDFDFATDELEDEIECPTCGAGYHNSFADRFGIARDEDQMRTLLVKLQEEYGACSSELQRKRCIAAESNACLIQINEILQMRQGEVRLHDILRSEGKKEMREVLRQELDILNRRIGVIDDEVESAEKEMREASSSKRSREIKDYYRGRMASFLRLLQVKELMEDGYKEVYSPVKENGSDGPRALLAFYFAILQTIVKYSTTTICPIVIDSPKQQDQDDENWRSMLRFIRDQRPTDAQVILALVDDAGIDMGGDVIELKDERQLLQKDQFDEVAAEVRKYLDLATS
jgi:hypothetical protein